MSQIYWDITNQTFEITTEPTLSFDFGATPGTTPSRNVYADMQLYLSLVQGTSTNYERPPGINYIALYIVSNGTSYEQYSDVQPGGTMTEQTLGGFFDAATLSGMGISPLDTFQFKLITYALEGGMETPTQQFFSGDLSYHSSSGSSLNYHMTYQSGSVPCFAENCNILTPTGYVNVKDLKRGSDVVTPEGKIVKIQKVFKQSQPTASNAPFTIKAGQLGTNLPSSDMTLSRDHAFNVNSRWIYPRTTNLSREWNDQSITWYNFKLPNPSLDFMICNGVPVIGAGVKKLPLPVLTCNINKDYVGFKSILTKELQPMIIKKKLEDNKDKKN